MANIDREVLRVVRNEWMAGAGGMVAVQVVFYMLNEIERIFGDNFSIERACEDLDRLSKMSTKIKEALQKQAQSNDG